MCPASHNQKKQRHLLHVFSTFSVGGPQVRFAKIINALGESYRHSVIALDGQTEAARLVASGVDLNLMEAPSTSGWLLARLARYRGVLRLIRPDLLVTYNWGSIEWSLSNFFPLCRHLHIEDGFGLEEAHAQLRRRVWTRRLALSSGSITLVPSLKLVGIALNEWGLPKDRMRYVPNGIDCGRFENRPPDADLVERLNLPVDIPIVGSVTALRPEKNLQRLIRAFAVVEAQVPAHLVIVGEGPERKSLEDLRTELCLQDKVTFAGHIDHPERILGAFDIFALSSDTEQMPYSVLEAMSAGLPIAGIDVGDVKVMVADPNKDFITHRSVDALAHVLSQLLKSRERHEKIGQANQLKVKSKFSESLMISRYKEIFDNSNAKPHNIVLSQPIESS